MSKTTYSAKNDHFSTVLTLVMSQVHTWLGAVATNSGLAATG